MLHMTFLTVDLKLSRGSDLFADFFHIRNCLFSFEEPNQEHKNEFPDRRRFQYFDKDGMKSDKSFYLTGKSYHNRHFF